LTKTIPAKKARSGLLGRPVLVVLITALILAAVVWAGVEWYGEAIDNSPAATGTVIE